MDKPDLPAETLDRVEIGYEVKASFWVGAGVYNGIPDAECLAALINDRQVQPEDIDAYCIREVTVDDQVVARA